jgi:hypothetical protein
MGGQNAKRAESIRKAIRYAFKRPATFRKNAKRGSLDQICSSGGQPIGGSDGASQGQQSNDLESQAAQSAALFPVPN